MTEILLLKLDIAAFATTALIATLIVIALMRRRNPRSRAQIVLLACSIVLVAGTSICSHVAGQSEQRRLVQMVSGIAPTYALELNRNGHDAVNLETAADDPAYLRLIELEKQWLKTNPAVADIYSMMPTSDGRFAFVVDSETDYDHNGAFDDDREARTDIGEVYGNESSQPAIASAIRGTSVFDSVVAEDRWGVWVSAYEPIRDASGKVYAVVGVDFPAERWVASILGARVTYLLIGLVTLAVVLVAGFMIASLQAEVSRRQVAEASARTTESRLRMIVDNEPEAVIVLDDAGLIDEINPAGARLLGEEAAKLVGQPLQRFLGDAQQPDFEAHRRRVIDGATEVIELQVTAADRTGAASTAWLDSHAVPLPVSPGEPRRMLMVARDITHRRTAEAERESLQRQLLDASRQAGMAEVATGVLHNVGNVLNSVNVSARMVLDNVRASRLSSLGKLVELVDQEKSRLQEFVSTDARGRCLPEFLTQLHARLRDDQELVQTELDQLVRGVEHIKEVVRMQQSSATSSNLVLPTDPVAIIEDAIKINLVSMERHHVHIERHYEPDLPLVPLDKHKILQILINLISNAKKATCTPDVAERRVTVGVRRIRANSAIEFFVRDNGIGIPADKLTELFRHGRSYFHQGHGFGLHSGANAAAEMHGSLSVHSDGVGTGATFTLVVPLAPATMPEVAA